MLLWDPLGRGSSVLFPEADAMLGLLAISSLGDCIWTFV